MIDGSLLRVLITRLSAVGDCIHTMPLAAAIRARYPRAMIAWCVEGGAASLVKAHPAVNRMVVLKKGWLQSPVAVAQARQALRALRCDVVIDPQSLSKSAIAGWLSGARTRIGFAPPQGREVAPWLHTVRIDRTSTHVVDSYLELLQPLDIVKPAAKFGIRVDDESLSSVDKFVFHASLKSGYAVINPGAGWDSKVWPNERYASVAKHLGHSAGLKSVVVWAGDRERRWAEEIVAGSGGHAVLAPKTSLLELAGLVKSAKFFVGSDTGPLHLAASFGTPCIALFGSTKGEESGPYGEGHITLQKQYHDGSCTQRRGADNSAMCAIEVADVCDACDEMLDRVQHQQPPTRCAA
jgi:lipopolysaccharide heptosyltransferase I